MDNISAVFYIVLIFGSVFALFFCIKRAKGFSPSNLMLKTAASLAFILTGVTALLSNPKAYIYGATIIFGGVLGLCGDIMLDLKGLHAKHKKTYMLGGFIFFLIGHIVYELSVIFSAGLKFWVVLICIAASIIASSVNYIFSEKVSKYNFGGFKFIVWLYTVLLILTTAVSAAAMITTHFEMPYILMTIGGALFMISDAILSGTYFGEGLDKPIHYFTNHLTYYAAQFLIMCSIFAMK